MIGVRDRGSVAFGMPLCAHWLVASTLGVVGVTGAGVIVGPWLGLGSSYPWRASAVFVAMMAIAATFLREHPFPSFGAANYVTTIRVMLVALIAGLGVVPASCAGAWVALGIAVLALALDGADGWLARRSRMASVFGARFDMETDALLVMVLSILAWQHGKAGAWVLLCGLMRYAFVVAGWLLPWMRRELRPTLRGRAVCVSQIVGLGAAMVPLVRTPSSEVVAALTLTALCWSFALDVLRLWRERAGLPVTRRQMEATGGEGGQIDVQDYVHVYPAGPGTIRPEGGGA